MRTGPAPPPPPDGRDPIEELAEDFLGRHRRGEQPSLEEYAVRRPDLAERIRRLFPALLAMEDLGPEETLAGASPRGVDLPARLGEYRILREIGRGGMGIVCEAEQETLGRRVALKILSRQAFAGEVHIERFRREARAAARLHHTNIVPVFGVGEEGGVHYYAMQFIRGQSLADVITEVKKLRAGNNGEGGADAGAAASAVSGILGRGLETEAEAGEGTTGGAPAAGHDPGRGERPSHLAYHRSVARIGLQAAEALAYAHAEGVLHRDIKPSNIILDTRGTTWVADFGLAKGEETGDLTATGQLVGTLRYMAPERFQGVEEPRSDIYSLAMTLYELLALRPAFVENDRARLLQEVVAREPPALRRLCPGIPRDLETIILKAGARRPQDRYRTATDLADDLRRFLHHEPVAARRATTAERIWRWGQRNPMVAGLSAAIAVLTVALAVGGTISAGRLRQERDTAFERLTEAKLEEGKAWRRSRAPGRRARSLAAFREARAGGRTLELRNEALGSLAIADLEVEGEWPLSGARLITDDFLERRATVTEDHVVMISGIGTDGRAGGAPLAVLRGPPTLQDGLFSRSGRYFVAKYEGPRVLVWDCDGKHPPLELPEVRAGFPVAFHPGEELIACTEPDGALALRSLPEGTLRRRLADGPRCFRLAFDPQGRRLAAAVVAPADAFVRILDADSGAIVARLHHPQAVTSFVWHPGGEFLATACHDFKVYLWEAGTGRRRRVLEGHRAEVTRVAFSHGGAFLASTGWDNETRLWDAFSGERLGAANGYFTAFARDDRRLGYHIGSTGHGVWRIAWGGEHRLLEVPTPAPREKQPMDLTLSPDGRWLAAACGLGGARLWSLAAPDRAVDLAIGETDGVRFHPRDGSLLTSGAGGVRRWPARREEGSQGGVWVFGPGADLGLGGRRLDLDAAGRQIALLESNAVRVHELEAPHRELARFEHSRIRRAGFSPSGRWLVTSTWQGTAVRVWDVPGRSLAKEFAARSGLGRFSPDERWLAVAVEGKFAIHEVGSWRLAWEAEREDGGDIPGMIAFASDSSILALARSQSRLDFFAVGRWEEIARLETPDGGHLGWTELDLSGTFVASASTTQQAVRLWNLRALRGGLAALGLDWSPPPAELPPPLKEPPPAAVRFEGGGEGERPAAGLSFSSTRDLETIELTTRLIALEPKAHHYLERAAAQRRLGNLDDALADIEAALAAAPGDPEAMARRDALIQELRGAHTLATPEE